MSDNKFEILDVSDIKFLDSKTGEEIKDYRDTKPIEKKFNPDTPILELVKKSYPSFELSTHPLIREYGYDTFGSVNEAWYWYNDKLSEASEKLLWKIFALIQADWLCQYEYLYYKEVYEFRKYKREQK